MKIGQVTALQYSVKTSKIDDDKDAVESSKTGMQQLHHDTDCVKKQIIEPKCQLKPLSSWRGLQRTTCMSGVLFGG